jgi:hypothetical protein
MAKYPEAKRINKAAPDLQGSKKQVAWADSIRKAYIQFYGDSRTESCERAVVAHPQAAYWIENRHGLGVTNAEQWQINQLIAAYQQNKK